MGNDMQKNNNHCINSINNNINISKSYISDELFEINLVNKKIYKDNKSETTITLLGVVDKLIEYKYKDTIEYKKYINRNLKRRKLLKNLSKLF